MPYRGHHSICLDWQRVFRHTDRVQSPFRLMQYTLKDLPKSQKEAKVTVEAAELKPFMERAATSLSEQVKIEGFRPGKADYDTVVRRVGEMAILEEALPK